MVTRKLVTLAIATAAFTVAPAFAAPPEADARIVRYADLDLTNSAGVSTLHHRIAAAVEAVCGSYEGSTLEEERMITQCRAQARAQADIRVAALLSARAQLASAR